VSLLRRDSTPPEERIPHPGRSQLLRAALGGLIILVLTSAAVATAALLQVSDLVRQINPTGHDIPNDSITRAEAGAPQTFLILGSDRRFDELKANNPSLKADAPARSDTMMLVRLDPDQAATSILSLPRDLKVDIPGYGTDKLNASYALGGPTLTVKTIKAYTGLDVNHVININFGGFRDVVNAIGCVYIDVDRRYYHSNAGLPVSQRYAEIDIDPGYQKLCGTDALDYVRYRHFDSDIVRAARQQSFLRQAKDQLNTSSLIGKRNKLIKIFGKNTQTDKSLKSTAGILSVFKLALYSAGHPVRQIQFPASYDASYVTATQTDVRRTVEEFLHPRRKAAKKDVQLTPDSTPGRKKPQKRSTSPAQVPGLVDGRRTGADVLASKAADSKLPFPIYFPKYVTSTSRYADPSIRIYRVADRAAKFRRAYRLVLSHNVVEGQYWGVQGTNWPSPPILQGTHAVITRHGRRLGVYRDGAHVHVVSWRRGKAVYWVSNTLSDALSNTQMLEIAATLTHDFS
jgi:polyisoprenyl-teichoic acid--peptidoglycan teichoic acid transferase